MTDEPEVPEAAAEPIEVAETHLLFRLTPAFADLAQPHRQIALVPARSEDEARQLARAADPFGRDWTDAAQFSCAMLETPERHVIGDVVFQSVAAAATVKPRRTPAP